MNNLNEWTAINIMGWFIDSSNWTDYYADGKTNEFIMDCLNWNPDTDLNQAHFVANAYSESTGCEVEFTIRRREKPLCIIRNGVKSMPGIFNDNPAMAICEAIYEAEKDKFMAKPTEEQLIKI